MSARLAFQQHETFHKAFLRMGAAGLGAGLALHLVTAGLAAGLGAGWRLAVVAGAVFAAAIGPQLAGRRQAVLAGLLGIAGATFLITPARNLPLGLTAAALAGAALSLWSLRGRRLALGLLVATPVVAVAALVFARLENASLFSGLPPVIPAVLAGAAFASVAVLTQLPRHVVIVADRVGVAHRKLAGAQGEVAALAGRGIELWRRTDTALEPADPNREILEEAVIRLLDVASRWSDVEAESGRAQPESLQARLSELEARLQAAGDPVVREQYRSAMEALREQLRYLDDIKSSRERVLARMHNYLAAMERLELALVNVKSTTASKSAVDVQPLAEALSDLGRDIDALGEALEA